MDVQYELGWNEAVKALETILQNRVQTWQSSSGKCALSLEEECEDILVCIQKLQKRSV